MRDESEWICVEDNHEPIISKKDFEIANDLILSDTRAVLHNNKTYLFSGLVFCGDCKQGMVHRVVESGGKKYGYYICSTYRLDTKACTIHNISEKALQKIVESAIRAEIQAVMKLKRLLDYAESLPRQSFEALKIDKQLMSLNEQLKQNEGYKTAAFEMYVKGKISEKMYREYADLYEKKCVEIRTVIETRKQTMQDVMDRKKPHIEWVEYFEKHKDFKELDRLLLVRTVKRIYIHPNKRIEIEFIHQADYNAAMEYIVYARKMAKTFDAKETV